MHLRKFFPKQTIYYASFSSDKSAGKGDQKTLQTINQIVLESRVTIVSLAREINEI